MGSSSVHRSRRRCKGDFRRRGPIAARTSLSHTWASTLPREETCMAWTDARRAGAATTVVALAALMLPPLVSAQSPIKTDAGLVSGANASVAGVRQYLGIPYAAPPVGPNRW